MSAPSAPHVRRARWTRPFRTPVRGYAFAAAPGGQEVPAPGEPGRLVREPANPADELAVAVWLTPPDGRSWRIGYLDRHVAARLAPRLDEGQRITVEIDGWSPEPDGRWQRPVVRLIPSVPDPAPEQAPHPQPGPATDPARARALEARMPGVRRRRIR
ncbi:MAG: hypothetical protein JJT89_14505 [Nitriliruptoraceae bacterium]|nr:hypothetical protein [Nitriliruptoraceae bacterium]